MYAIRPGELILTDEGRRRKKDEYGNVSYLIFQGRLDELKKLTRPMTPAEKKEVQVLTRALLDAKRFFEDDK